MLPALPAHKQIADRGARALSRALGAGGPPLAALSLADNRLHEEGGRALARLLRGGASGGGCGGGGGGLLSLDLRLNRLGGGGCKAVLDALRPGSGGGGGSGSGGGGGLERLSLAANGAGPAAAAPLAAALRDARALAQLDVSGNALGPAAGAALAAAAREAGPALRALDVRGCGLRVEDEEAVREELLLRAERRGAAALADLQGL